MRAFRMQPSQADLSSGGRRIVQWPALFVVLFAAALLMAGVGGFIVSVFEGHVGTEVIALIIGFVLLVASLRGQRRSI